MTIVFLSTPLINLNPGRLIRRAGGELNIKVPREKGKSTSGNRANRGSQSKSIIFIGGSVWKEKARAQCK